MPDLLRYQLRDGPHVGVPTTERGEIERLAGECEAASCHACLDWIVIETRFSVVRFRIPDLVTKARKRLLLVTGHRVALAHADLDPTL